MRNRGATSWPRITTRARSRFDRLTPGSGPNWEWSNTWSTVTSKSPSSALRRQSIRDPRFRDDRRRSVRFWSSSRRSISNCQNSKNAKHLLTRFLFEQVLRIWIQIRESLHWSSRRSFMHSEVRMNRRKSCWRAWSRKRAHLCRRRVRASSQHIMIFLWSKISLAKSRRRSSRMGRKACRCGMRP